MKAVQFALGRPVADFDLLIAATAVRHGLTRATLNVRHFQLIQGLIVEDWSREGMPPSDASIRTPILADIG